MNDRSGNQTRAVPGGRRRAVGAAALSLALVTLLAACGDSNRLINPPAAAGYRAEIRRTSLGVPHIKANDWAGLGYGYGYAQAEDSLCTLADAFLTYRGERSRWLGADTVARVASTIGRPKNIDSDFFHRQLLADAPLQAMAAAQPPQLQQLVQGFAAGYNRYVRELQQGDPATAPGAHAACRSEPWLQPITTGDLWRRLYQANFAGGYSRFVAAIANAQPPQAQVQAQAGLPPPIHLAEGVGGDASLGSNAIGFGREATGGPPLLFGNPHWFWRGADRFYQAQLSIPGQLNVSGASFLGVPLILIGFNDNVAWSHTVSTARRFGFFQLTLAPDDATAYVRDGQKTPLQAQRITVEVKDGAPVTRTLYRSEHGPLINLAAMNPALAWSRSTAFAIRDINADNHRPFATWLRWNQARSLDELIAVQKRDASIPWVNTIAVGRGSHQAWYADIGAMPNVPPELLSRCAAPAAAGLAAALPLVPVLDGSRAACQWASDPVAVQPGALPAARMPSLLRDDYVANMNDSHWLSNPAAPLTGYPALVGPDGNQAQSLRTRLGHLLVRQRLAGSDGLGAAGARIEALQRMVLNSRVLSAELMKDGVLALACNAPTLVDVTRDAANGRPVNPPRTVDIGPACAALRAWDGSGRSESRGALIWDEFWLRADKLGAAALYETPFNAADPIHTPRGIKPAAAAALREALGAATLVVQASGFALDAPRGELVYATRNGQRIPLFGGCHLPGYYTIQCAQRALDRSGYTQDDDPNANSYMQLVRFDEGGVQAHTFLTFSQSDDPASPHHADYTRRYAAQQWHRVPFTEAEIRADPAYRSRVLAP